MLRLIGLLGLMSTTGCYVTLPQWEQRMAPRELVQVERPLLISTTAATVVVRDGSTPTVDFDSLEGPLRAARPELAPWLETAASYKATSINAARLGAASVGGTAVAATVFSIPAIALTGGLTLATTAVALSAFAMAEENRYYKGVVQAFNAPGGAQQEPLSRGE